MGCANTSFKSFVTSIFVHILEEFLGVTFAYLCGLEVGVSQHLADGLIGTPASQGNQRCE